MRTIRANLHLLTLLLAVPLLAACGSAGIGPILGGGTPTNTTAQLEGTVQRVDTTNRTITVADVSGVRSGLRNGGDTEVLYYDNSTEVTYQGASYRPADLEAGDRIVAQVEESGNRLLADQIQVTYDVSSGGYGTGSGVPSSTSGFDADLRGTVRSVDTRAHVLNLERTRYGQGFDAGSTTGDVVSVHYDSGTAVYYQGQTYDPSSLERGDVVDVDLRSTANGWWADAIRVVADVRAASPY